MTDEQYEEWCAKLIIVGGQAFLPSEAHIVDYERRKWAEVDPEQRRRYQRNWRERRRAATA